MLRYHGGFFWPGGFGSRTLAQQSVAFTHLDSITGELFRPHVNPRNRTVLIAGGIRTAWQRRTLRSPHARIYPNRQFDVSPAYHSAVLFPDA